MRRPHVDSASAAVQGFPLLAVITESKEVLMWQRLSIAGLLVALSACAPLPPLPGDAAAKRFEPVADRAVIYVVRHPLELDFVAPVLLDDQSIGSTYRGTYIRVVVPGGMHRFAGMAADSGAIRLKAEPGQIYFINHSTFGYSSLTGSSFQLVDAQFGRSMVLGGAMTSEFIQ
jgi:hypothetical protein